MARRTTFAIGYRPSAFCVRRTDSREPTAESGRIHSQQPAVDRARRAPVHRRLQTDHAERSLVVAFVMLLVASINGAVREAFLVPALGDAVGCAAHSHCRCSRLR
jgi:hypothetical protein